MSLNGFLIFLCVLAGIIGLIVLLLSVPLRVSFSYSDKIYLTVKYLFLKIDVLPIGEKKKKKEKPKKEEEPKPEEPKEEEPPKEKKPNRIVEMAKANGFDGMMQILQDLGRVLAKYGKKLFSSVVFDDIEIYVTVGTGDAAGTAIEYGKVCRIVYPLLGFICNNNAVKRYDASVEPDFLANHSEGEFSFEFHLIIRKIINATLGMAVRLVFKVLLKFLKGAKKGENSAQQPENQNVK